MILNLKTIANIFVMKRYYKGRLVLLFFLINILFKAIILFLFYLTWQNVEYGNFNHNLIYFYLIIVILSLIVERFLFKNKKVEDFKQNKTLSVLISIFSFSILMFPLIEYLYFIRNNTLISTIGIIIVFTGIVVRGLSIKYINKYYSKDIKSGKEESVIKEGLHKYIRHPEYLGNLLKFIGFPLILNSYYSLILSTITIYCFKKKLEFEERNLKES